MRKGMIGPLTDEDLSRQIADVIAHARDRSAEVSENLAKGWAVSVTNTGAPGDPINPTTSGSPVLTVTRNDAQIAQFTIGLKPGAHRRSDTVVEVLAFPEGGSLSHLKQLMSGLSTAVIADKKVIQMENDARREELDTLFGEVAP